VNILRIALTCFFP